MAPLIYLLVRAAEVDPQTLTSLLFRQRTLDQLWNTVRLTGTVVLLGTVVALPLAWLVTSTDMRHRRLLTWLAATPLAIPGYVTAYALLGLGGWNGLVHQFTGVIAARPSGFTGAAVALTLYTYPYMFLNLRSAFLGMDPRLEEAARSLGQDRWRTFFRVVLPQLRPALLAGSLVIALYVLGDFGVVALMRFETFSFAIYNQYTGAFNRSYAAWLGLIVVLLALIVLLLEGRLLNRNSLAGVTALSSRRRLPLALGWRAAPAWLFTGTVLGAALGLPLFSLASWLSLAPPDLPALRSVVESFAASASLAVPAAAICALWALPLAHLATRRGQKAGRFAVRLVHLGYAVPPVALALAFVMFTVRSASWLYQTPAIVILAYVISYQALAIGPVRSGLLQLNSSLVEAARSLGRSRAAAFLQTTLPQLRGNLLASGALVLMVTMKELPLTYMLAPAGTSTLAMRVFSRTNEGMMAEAAPFAAAIVLFSALFTGLLIAYEGRGRGN